MAVRALCTVFRTMDKVKPKLIVFDLDYTLWPFWVDTHVDPPFTKDSKGRIFDTHRVEVKCYSDVPSILDKLYKEGYQLGVASRTSCTQEARDLVKLFDWEKYFNYMEIYPGSKLTHFKKFKEQSGLAYEDMMFFDDETRNIREVGGLGVTCVFAENGVTNELLSQGLQTYKNKFQTKYFDNCTI